MVIFTDCKDNFFLLIKPNNGIKIQEVVRKKQPHQQMVLLLLLLKMNHSYGLSTVGQWVMASIIS
ncbi:MAG: hypothetical protein EA409_00415 [Saprospirales bacterium]|nr:MAG: hypothetical protein EA409_00415 [Saprospirales bacterium]